MRGRGRRKHAATGAVPSVAREDLERRWHRRLRFEPRLARLVTAAGATAEPFHRWMPYRQGFSPELVRLFLRENWGPHSDGSKAPVLDAFSGSGAVVLECARGNVPAVGVEAAASLVFLSSVAADTHVPPLPDLRGATCWEAAADRLDIPIHRAALMYAVGRQHTAAGKRHVNAPPLPEALDEVVGLMRDDLRKPLPRLNPVRLDDARRLDTVGAAAIRGILTSPPYLSRYDYTQVLRPYEMVYRHWGSAGRESGDRVAQIAAHPGATVRASPEAALPPAAEEAALALLGSGRPRLARVVRAYFRDMFDVMPQCGRVLRSGGPCWMVIGGARLKGVYVPSDLILAEHAASWGFEVRSVRVARSLIDVGRKLGRLSNVAPREVVLELRKR